MATETAQGARPPGVSLARAPQVSGDTRRHCNSPWPARGPGAHGTGGAGADRVRACGGARRDGAPPGDGAGQSGVAPPASQPQCSGLPPGTVRTAAHPAGPLLSAAAPAHSHPWAESAQCRPQGGALACGANSTQAVPAPGGLLTVGSTPVVWAQPSRCNQALAAHRREGACARGPAGAPLTASARVRAGLAVEDVQGQQDAARKAACGPRSAGPPASQGPFGRQAAPAGLGRVVGSLCRGGGARGSGTDTRRPAPVRGEPRSCGRHCLSGSPAPGVKQTPCSAGPGCSGRAHSHRTGRALGTAGGPPGPPRDDGPALLGRCQAWRPRSAAAPPSRGNQEGKPAGTVTEKGIRRRRWLNHTTWHGV